MEITGVYTDTDGGSHFEKWPVVMDNESSYGFISSLEKNIKSFHFQNTLPHHKWDFENVPDRMYIVLLSGSLEIEVSDGEKRCFVEGDVILLEDKSGNGHKLETFEDTQCSLIIHLNYLMEC